MFNIFKKKPEIIDTTAFTISVLQEKFPVVTAKFESSKCIYNGNDFETQVCNIELEGKLTHVMDFYGDYVVCIMVDKKKLDAYIAHVGRFDRLFDVIPSIVETAHEIAAVNRWTIAIRLNMYYYPECTANNIIPIFTIKTEKVCE